MIFIGCRTYNFRKYKTPGTDKMVKFFQVMLAMCMLIYTSSGKHIWNRGLSGYNTENLTVDRCGYRVRRVPRRSLYAKDIVCRLKKGGHCNSYTRLIVASLHSCLYFLNGNQKSLTRLIHSFPHFYILVFIYCLTCSRPEHGWSTSRWVLSNSQSINIYSTIINIYMTKSALSC
jgi:hypothetical protein